MINDFSISEFRRILKLHEDWLLYVFVGTDLLSHQDLSNLYLYDKLPIEGHLNLITQFYTLGKYKSHLKTADYQNLTGIPFMELSSVERESLMELKLKASLEIRSFIQILLDYLQPYILKKDVEGLQYKLDNLKALFKKVYKSFVLDYLYSALNTAMVDTARQHEGIYVEGLESRFLVKGQYTSNVKTARELLDLSLSGLSLYYLPPGTEWLDNKLVINDQTKFTSSLMKAATPKPSPIIKPPGPPQAFKPASPPSMPGVAAPGNNPGPGRPQNPSTQSSTVPAMADPNAPSPGVEYDKWLGPNDPKPKDMTGWEQTSTGGYRHIKGSGGFSAQGENEQTIGQYLKEWNDRPKSSVEVAYSLSHGSIDKMAELSDDEAGVYQSYKITIQGNGQGLMKPRFSDLSDFENRIGSGLGSIPLGNEHNREVAAHKLDTLLGGNNIPVTVTRSFGGESHSVQEWQENHTIPYLYLGESSEQNVTKDLLSRVPEKFKGVFEEKIHNMVVSDIIMNHNDRHHNNTVIKRDSSSFAAIDNAFSFGIGMKGIKNDFHKDLHQMGKPVKIPADMKHRLENTTLGDFKRSLQDHLSDWEIGQTFLRSRYVLYLQNNEGHLDYNKFLPTIDKFGEDSEMPGLVPASSPGEGEYGNFDLDSAWKVNNSSEKGLEEFRRRKEEKTLPNDLFNSWAKHFIGEAKANENHPDHQAAKELDKIGVFMAPESVKNPFEYRKNGRHREYEETIEAKLPSANVGHRKPVLNPKAYTSTVKVDND